MTRSGNEILAVSAYKSLVFNSKKQACEKLGINHKTLDRLIEENLPLWFQGQELWLDELVKGRAN